MSRKTSPTRRTVIKTIGAGCALSSLGAVAQGTSTSEQDFRDLIDQAHEVRQEAAEEAAKEAQEIRDSDDSDAEERARKHRISKANEAWEDFLTENNLSYANKNQQYEFNEKSDNRDSGISIQSVSDVSSSGINATLSLIKLNYKTYYATVNFELYFSYRTTGHACYREDYGEDPKDGAGLRWNSDAWNYDGDTFSERSSTSSNVSYTDEVNSQEAFAFNIDDSGMFSDWADEAECSSGLDNNFTSGYSSNEHFGVYLQEDDDSDDYSEDDTWILGAYDHTWTGSRGAVQIGGGVTAAGPSISIGYSSTQTLENQTTTTEEDGDTPLEVYRDDASYSVP